MCDVICFGYSKQMLKKGYKTWRPQTFIMVQPSGFSSIQINVNQTKAGRKNSRAPLYAIGRPV